MAVTEIHGEGDWNTQMQNAGGKLVVADFSATWCGPCQFIKPTYEQYSRQYSDVVFLGVDEGQNKSLISALGVRGFPTFHFYLNQRKVDELVGADPNALRQKIEQWRQSAFNPFASPGVSLGGSTAATADDARAARLRRFNQMNLMPQAPPAPVPSPPTSTPHTDADLAKMVCDPITGKCSIPNAETADDSAKDTAADTADGEDDVAMEDSGLPPVNEEFLTMMVDMGFNDLRSRKALLATSSQNLELAINWISEHQEDPDIDEPIKFVDLSASANAPLTEEEKAAKVAALQAKIEQRRAERAEEEKKKKQVDELTRRSAGRGIQEAREEYEAMQRKIESEKRMRERDDAKRERERLRKQIEEDKLRRRMNNGKLTGAPTVAVESKEEASSESKHSSVQQPPEVQMASSIAKLKKYRLGGDGLTALKTLNVYVKNLIEKPDEEKFRSINLENPAFRKRVASLVGGVAFLKALGYEKDEADGLLKLSLENRNDLLLRSAKSALERAIAELA